jgi:hypothetical protein
MFAADLLQRVRATAHERQTDGWTDDPMRGHVLIESFMTDHSLLWNRVLEEETSAETDRRRNRQLRQLLWAGLRTLATMSSPYKNVSNPWELLDYLDGGEVVAQFAERETGRIESATEEDETEIEYATAAHAAVWLAIRRPDLLTTEQGIEIIDAVSDDVSSFHQLVHSALIMAGAGPVGAAVKDQTVSEAVQSPMEDFVRAQEVTEQEGFGTGTIDAETGDPYNDMHAALEEALEEDDDDLLERLYALLTIVGSAAKLTASEVNPHLGDEGYISDPRGIAMELLKRPAEYAALILSEVPDEKEVLRLGTLAKIARVAPVAAGEMASDLPGLVGEDPRVEPAAQERARRWVIDALQAVQDDGHPYDQGPALSLSIDARALLDALTTGDTTPEGWPIRRFVAAAAEAVAGLLQGGSSAHLLVEVFTRA